MRLPDENRVFNPEFVARVHAKRRKLAAKAQLEHVRSQRAARRQTLLAPVGGRPLAKHIIEMVADQHDVSLRDLLGPTRGTKLVCEVRKLALAAVMQARPDMSITQIARAFNRDHSTLLQTMGPLWVEIQKGQRK